MYLVEWMWLDLWEFVLHVIRVHRSNLLSCGSPEDFDNLH